PDQEVRPPVVDLDPGVAGGDVGSQLLIEEVQLDRPPQDAALFVDFLNREGRAHLDLAPVVGMGARQGPLPPDPYRLLGPGPANPVLAEVGRGTDGPRPRQEFPSGGLHRSLPPHASGKRVACWRLGPLINTSYYCALFTTGQGQAKDRSFRRNLCKSTVITTLDDHFD